jgi:acyl-CoA synthetase (AMP-forming)/AMP-acid ligase II
LAPKVFHELEKALKAPVLEAYAMTEASHQMTSNPLPPAKRIPGSVGLGQGVEVVIVGHDSDEILSQGSTGEICIKGPNVTAGYLHNPAANATAFTSGGYFRTGDQGYLDADGYVFITGRIKELINKGGEKISPIELDNVLSGHPGVGEAVSFAMEDDHYGQDIGVAIVRKTNDDGQKLTEEDVKKYMAEKLAKFKVPKRVFFTDVMPKTATGKVQRRSVGEAMTKSSKESTSGEKPRARL